MNYTLPSGVAYSQPERLSDAELGALIRRTLSEAGVERVEVYGREGRERVDAIRITRKRAA